MAPANQHFSTDHLTADIKGRSVRGGAVTLVAQVAKFLLQIGSTAVLARLLTPDDFGLLALVAVFTGFIGLFNDLGLSMATVQRADVSQPQVAALFWINVAVGVLLALITVVLAPVVAWIYGQPLLTGIMIAVACTFIFGGLTAQHTALLRRQMKFMALAAIDVGAMAAGMTAAVVAASMGAGYWSLVVLSVVGATANLGLVWLASSWRPTWPQRSAEIGSMIRFGGNLTLANMVNYFARNADNMLIGWYWGAGPLGLYSKAYGLLMLPLRQINAPIAAVAIPALSRVQHDPVLFRDYYCRTVRLITYLTVPGIALLCASADQVVLLLLGAQWVQAAKIFEIFAYASLLQPITVTLGWLYVSLGNTRRMVYWTSINSVLAVAAFTIGLPYGAIGVAWATACCMYVLSIPSMLVAMHKTPLKVRDVAVAVWRGYGLAAAVFAGALAGRHLLHAPHALTALVASSGVATLAAIALIAVWRGLRQEIWSMIRVARHLNLPRLGFGRPKPAL